jgi:hypothetical protein
MLSEIGQQNFDGWLEHKGGTEYARLASGESAAL